MHPATRPELPCPIAPYVPQRHGMCLLDRLVTVDDDSLQAEVTPGTDDLFASADGIPAWTGLEWLAQAVAAWAGWHASARNAAPALGFLIGTKRFETTTAHFAFDQPFTVRVHLDFRADNGLGHFHGEILDQQDTPVAWGTLTVFQPPADEAPSPAPSGETRS